MNTTHNESEVAVTQAALDQFLATADRTTKNALQAAEVAGLGAGLPEPARNRALLAFARRHAAANATPRSATNSTPAAPAASAAGRPAAVAAAAPRAPAAAPAAAARATTTPPAERHDALSVEAFEAMAGDEDFREMLRDDDVALGFAAMLGRGPDGAAQLQREFGGDPRKALAYVQGIANGTIALN